MARDGDGVYIVMIKAFLRLPPAEPTVAAARLAAAAVQPLPPPPASRGQRGSRGSSGSGRRRASSRKRVRHRRAEAGSSGNGSGASSDGGPGGEAGGSEGGDGGADAPRVVAALAAQLQQPPVLRMAWCDVYQAEHVDTWRGESYRVRDVERPWRTDVLLPLDELGAKVVACFEGRGAANATPRRAANAPGHGAANAPGPAVVFIAYGNMSGTV